VILLDTNVLSELMKPVMADSVERWVTSRRAHARTRIGLAARKGLAPG
jgi:predicted nucleic acid-binding protein